MKIPELLDKNANAELEPDVGVVILPATPVESADAVALGDSVVDGRVSWQLANDVVELTKVRVALLVLLTTAVGYLVASRFYGVPADLFALLGMLFATGLVAGGAATWNQLLEQDRDAAMVRTRERPLPAGRMSPTFAAVWGSALALTGGLYLALAVNGLTALLAAFTFASYVFVYTPLKTRTHLSTVVGAIPGGVPPLMGWAAASGNLSAPAWSLFAILFVWQLPHFLAIAWLYRDDYARGGYPMLTVVDETGGATLRQMLANAAALIPVSLVPSVIGLSGARYFWCALALSSAFFLATLWFSFRRTRRAARGVVLGSMAYLAVLLLALLFDHVPR